jgi:hypothetical protein
MNPWVLAIVVGGIIVIWFVVKRLYFDPAEREHKIAVRESMDRQAQKRNGQVVVKSGQPTLTVTHGRVEIDLSLVRYNDEIYREHTFARFKVEYFASKQFLIALNSKDLLLKPIPLADKLELSDQQFNEQFVVTGNDQVFINDLLTKQIREKLCEQTFQVSLGRRTDAAILNREQGWLTVFTQLVRTGDEVFDGLIDTAILFHDRLETLNAAATSSK